MQAQAMGGGHALELVVCLRDSLVQVHHQRRPGAVLVGSAPACQVMLPAAALAGAEASLLCGVDDQGAWSATSLQPGASRQRLVPGPGLTLAHGELRLFVRLVEDPEPPLPRAFRPDRNLAAALVGVTAFVLVSLGLAFAVAPDAEALTANDIWRDRQAILVRLKAREDAKVEPPTPSTALGTAGDGAAAAGVEAAGKMGTPDRVSRARTAIRGHESADRAATPEARQAVADHAGVLGVLSVHHFSQIAGAEGEAWGHEVADSYGADPSADLGDGQGSFGHGLQGDARGSCPPGVSPERCKNGLFGAGDYGQHLSDGDGGKDRLGQGGPGDPGLRAHTPKGPPKLGPISTDCEDDADGCIDAALLKRIIRSKLDRIGYCFERELQSGQASGGSMGMRYMINAQGRVAGVHASSEAGVQAAEACVTGVLESLQFPALPHAIMVTYPFVFHGR
jgi:hypothetical protein